MPDALDAPTLGEVTALSDQLGQPFGLGDVVILGGTNGAVQLGVIVKLTEPRIFERPGRVLDMELGRVAVVPIRCAGLARGRLSVVSESRSRSHQNFAMWLRVSPEMEAHLPDEVRQAIGEIRDARL